MPRSVWSGALSFGLVNIPVKLYGATSPKDVRFHLLHDRDGVRIQQKRVCPADGEEVAQDHLIKGYELSRDHYVPVEPREIEAIEPKKTRSIDIEDFVPLTSIDPLYFERTYYVMPDKGAGKAYRLLWSAMRDAQRVAIGRFVMHNKAHLAAIRPIGDMLALSSLLFADEIVKPETLGQFPAAVAPNERELGMARQLVSTLSTDFDPEKYRDDYREKLLALIERKAEGHAIKAPAARKEGAKVIDLMQALEASIAASRAKPAPQRRKQRRKA